MGGAEVERLLADHGRLVRSFFTRRCDRAEDAEDLAQEAFCALVEAWPRFRGLSRPSTWVWAICRNVYSRHLETRRRRERMVSELGAGLIGESCPDEERTDLALLVEGLSRGDRSLYECHYARGLTIRECALALERPEGTIKYQLSLLRRRFGELLSGAAPRRGV